MEYRFKLEKYNGKNRYQCPSCGAMRDFVRYVDEDGAYLAPDVGRCNREVNCGYHYTPRQFFADNPGSSVESYSFKTHRHKAPLTEARKPTDADFIQAGVLKQTLGAYNQNNFVRFLRSRFETVEVSNIVRRYLIGTWKDGRTIFWQIDFRGHIRTGKLIAYDAVRGKRIKAYKPSWIHAELKHAGYLSANFSLEQCFFGEHLLPREPERAVGVVESEKTAIIASLFMPDYLWVATGGGGNLNVARLMRAMEGRRVALFPDSSKFDKWSEKADEVRRMCGLKVRVSNLLEQRLTEEQRREDYDIADFLLAGKAEQENE